MKNVFQSYLMEIGIVTAALLERTESVIQSLKEFSPEGFSEIFVSDNVREDGTRDYLSLWAFSKNYVLEAKNFTNSNSDDFDFASTVTGIQYLRLFKTAYDFKEATPQSRLSCQFDMRAAHLSGELRASGNNCPYAWRCIRQYLLPKQTAGGNESLGAAMRAS